MSKHTYTILLRVNPEKDKEIFNGNYMYFRKEYKFERIVVDNLTHTTDIFPVCASLFPDSTISNKNRMLSQLSS